MVEVGQLRTFRASNQIFTVIDRHGKFYPLGAREGDPQENFFSILADGEVSDGWGASLIENESEIVHNSPSNFDHS